MPCCIVLQWCNVVLSVIIVLCCFIMLVYKIIMLCCVLLCWFVMFLYCFVQTCFSLLQWHHGTLQLKVFIPTPVSHHIYLRSQPTQSTPLFGTPQMTQSVSFTLDTRSTEIFLVLTMHQAQSVSNNTSHPSYLPVYTPDTIHACLQFQCRWPKAFPQDL